MERGAQVILILLKGKATCEETVISTGPETFPLGIFVLSVFNFMWPFLSNLIYQNSLRDFERHL